MMITKAFDVLEQEKRSMSELGLGLGQCSKVLESCAETNKSRDSYRPHGMHTLNSLVFE